MGLLFTVNVIHSSSADRSRIRMDPDQGTYKISQKLVNMLLKCVFLFTFNQFFSRTFTSIFTG